ncbi:MAG: hypothetical protein ACYC3X_20490 [Pirellulaceae bacterium]
MFRCTRSTVFRTLVLAFLAGLYGLTFPGCSRQEQNAVYEEPSADDSSATRQTTPLEAISQLLAERVITTTPDGWSPVPVEGMRKAAFRVERDSRKVDITLIDLAASAGDLLPNVNRWRQQIKLAEITQEELSKSMKEMELGGVVGHYVELIGPESEQPRQAVLAVIAIRESRAWFAKLWGDADLALEERERFQTFVQSLRFAAADKDRSQGASSATGNAQLQALNSTPKESIEYVVPEGWSPTEGSGVRRVTFEVKEGSLAAETTAMGLPGSATRLLPNVNLWRRQVGLEDTTQKDLDATLEPIEIDGRPGHYIRLAGPSDAERPLGMLVVLAGEQDRTWFFKMFGDSELVSRQKERFEEFVRSVKFVPAGGEKND